jgi:hypothetical protein
MNTEAVTDPIRISIVRFFAPFQGASAPLRVGFGALAETFQNCNWKLQSKKRNPDAQMWLKFALAGAPMPAREARALPKTR